MFHLKIVRLGFLVATLCTLAAQAKGPNPNKTQSRGWHNEDQNCPQAIVYSPTMAAQVPSTGGPYLIGGDGHNWQALSCNFQAVISTKNFNSPPRFVKNSNNKVVEVGAGVSMGVLLKFLENQGRTLETFPIESAVTVGGAIATASHGTSFKQGTISDSVVGVTVAPRILPTLNLKAFAANVGKLGVVTRLRLRTIPSIQMASQTDLLSAHDFFRLWDALIKKNARLQAWYDFQTQTVLVVRYQPAAKGLRFPPLNDVAQASGALTAKAKQITATSTGTLSELMLFHDDVPRIVAEYGVDRSQGIAAIQGLRAFMLKNKIGFEGAVNIRFGGYDRLPWLTSATSPAGTVYIDIDLPLGQQAQMTKIEDYMVNTFNARFHWGKFHTNSKKIEEKAYGRNIQKFERYQGKALKQLYGELA